MTNNGKHPYCPKCGTLGSTRHPNGFEMRASRWCPKCNTSFYAGRHKGED